MGHQKVSGDKRIEDSSIPHCYVSHFRYHKLFHFSLYAYSADLFRWPGLVSDDVHLDFQENEAVEKAELESDIESNGEMGEEIGREESGGFCLHTVGGDRTVVQTTSSAGICPVQSHGKIRHINLDSSTEFPSLNVSPRASESSLSQIVSQPQGLAWTPAVGKEISKYNPSRQLPKGTQISPEIASQWQLPESIQFQLAIDASKESFYSHHDQEEDLNEAIRRSLECHPIPIEAVEIGKKPSQESHASPALATEPSTTEKITDLIDNSLQEIEAAAEVKELREALLAASSFSGRDIDVEYEWQLKELEAIEKEHRSSIKGLGSRTVESESLGCFFKKELQQEKINFDGSRTSTTVMLPFRHRCRVPMTGLLDRRPTPPQSVLFNPQSREIAWLSLTPRRLAVFYKKKRKWQSWRF